MLSIVSWRYSWMGSQLFPKVAKVGMIAGSVYMLLLAVSFVSGGFKLATGNQVVELLSFATNPFLGLVVGTVATALVQSSSTVTSIIVGLVAGGMPVSIAIPMIMGANIGTTITNTIVSLGHINGGIEFKRAFAAATIHDFFNLLSVIIFLPLEMAFGFLEKLSGVLSKWLVGAGAVSIGDFNFLKMATQPIVSEVTLLFDSTFPEFWAGVLLAVFGVVTILVSITFLGKVLKSIMVGRVKHLIQGAIGRGPLAGIGSGTLVTILVQSSSTTTSLIVPLAGNGLFSLRQVYPFTLGANIGTCITALLASTAITGNLAASAVQIALVHLLYNVLGVVVIFGIPVLRQIPITCAEKLSTLALRDKKLAFGYVLGMFFAIPGACLGVSSLFH